MSRMRILLAMIFAAAVAALVPSAGNAAAGAKKTVKFYRVNIKSGYLSVRDAASVKGTVVAAFYPGNDCVPALGGSKTDAGRTWLEVYHPYLRASGWVDSKFLAATKSSCKFENFLLGTRGETDWVFDNIKYPLTIGTPNVDEKPTSYDEQQVRNSTSNPSDSPYYYLGLLDDGMAKKLWDERDGCARYELMDNKNYDVNLYKLYEVKRGRGTVSLTFICNEMYPEFKFAETKTGFVLTGIVDSGS